VAKVALHPTTPPLHGTLIVPMPVPPVGKALLPFKVISLKTHPVTTGVAETQLAPDLFANS
jgi:hypothetical protein